MKSESNGSGFMQYAMRIAPGLLFVLVLALGTRFAHGFFSKELARLVGEAVLGMVVGLAIGNLVVLPTRLSAGIQSTFKLWLPVSIVLLGARFNLADIAGIGGSVLVLICLLICLALVLAYQLCRRFGVPQRLGVLIGVGTAICGNTAITAVAPVIGAKDEEFSFAIAVNTLFGTLAVLVYPVLGRYLGLGEEFFGWWAGTAINDTSQVVAAGFSYSLQSGETATAVKLTRNALMGVVIVVVGLMFGQKKEAGQSLGLRIKQSLPPFVIGFLLMVLINTVGGIQACSDLVQRNLTADFTKAAKFLIVLALVGVGLNTKIASMRKVGMAPLYIGLATASTGAVISFLYITWFLI